MKARVLVLVFFLISFFIPQISFSQFQSANTECEAETVIANGSSVACKNYYSSLNNEMSFTGGSYPDCAVAASSATAGANNVSVLLNRGTNATACSDQFNTPANYVFSGINGSATITTLVGGRLNSTSGPSDIAILDGNTTPQISSINSAANGSGSFAPGTTANVSAQATGTIQLTTTPERSMALFDCDSDGDLDAAAVVRETSPSEALIVNISRNGGTGLAAVGTASFATGITGSLDVGPLAIGDFNNDGIPDVVVAGQGSNVSGMSVCINNGSCSLTCTRSAFQGHTGITVNPRGLAAGDFDGDGNIDAVISESQTGITSGVHYYYGNGAGGFSTTQHENITNTAATPNTITTGCFNSDNIVDAAVSVNGNGAGTGSSVDVFELNTARTATLVNLTFDAATTSIGGIDAADFDRGGRDDIMVEGTRAGSQQVYVFMNSLGAGVATAVAVINTPQQAIFTNTSLRLSGTCAMSDGSVSSFLVQWAITSPNAADATLTNATTLTPTFTATRPGTFTIGLTCTSVCGSVSNTASLTVTGIPAFDQGGCVSNSLVPFSGSVAFVSLLPLLGSIGFWFLKRRKNRKSIKSLFVFFFIFLLLGVFAKTSKATTSFSTNFFKPAVDDSEYISVYGSPLMKKKYYHAGFYLDYAHHPYEFGDNGFNRTNSITNHLLSGNLLGSYALFDWLNAGGRLPVYFWNGLHPALLGRGVENHIDLGDFEMVLKFKLIDRLKHQVGWSLLPFVTFPTGTRTLRDFTGDGELSGGFKMIVDGKPHDRVSLSLNLGYQARVPVVTPGGTPLNDNFLIGFGASGDAIKEKLKVIAETQIETVARDFFSKRRNSPAEARLGFRYMFPKMGLDANFGGGMGYTNGIGSPDFRLFAGVTYTKRPISKVTLKEDMGEVEVGDELKLADKIYFEFNEMAIRNISKPTLDKAAAFIKKHPEIKKLRVEGHTCDLGTTSYNQRLSEHRANAVVNYLVEQGVSRSILRPIGYGESQPMVPNLDEEHREQNRRVQFFVEEKE